MVKLFCAIAGVEESVFEVDIEETASVSALKFKIKDLNDDIKVPPRDLKLFLAKRDKGRGQWLTEEEAVKGVTNIADLELLTSMRSEIGNVGQSETDVRFEMTKEDVAKLLGPVNVMDPDLRADDSDKTLWYDGATLQIHVVFKEERDAFIFENELHHEGITQTSPLEGHNVSIKVASIHREATALRHILTRDYLPDETDFPKGTITSVSTNVSIVELETDEFKYQGIESEQWFGPLGKAESCHLISKEHPTHHKYDNDQNNRLALSSAMHGWYDGSNVNVPVVNISVESVSEDPEIGSRYKVNLIVRALDDQYAKLIFERLKEDSVKLEDPLAMRTFETVGGTPGSPIQNHRYLELIIFIAVVAWCYRAMHGENFYTPKELVDRVNTVKSVNGTFLDHNDPNRSFFEGVHFSRNILPPPSGYTSNYFFEIDHDICTARKNVDTEDGDQ